MRLHPKTFCEKIIISGLTKHYHIFEFEFNEIYRILKSIDIPSRKQPCSYTGLVVTYSKWTETFYERNKIYYFKIFWQTSASYIFSLFVVSCLFAVYERF